MAIEIITKDDLEAFEVSLLDKISMLLQVKADQPKPLLKSAEVKARLGISTGTLQHLRLTKTLGYTRIGSIFYYYQEDIELVLERNRVAAETTIFNY